MGHHLTVRAMVVCSLPNLNFLTIEHKFFLFPRSVSLSVALSSATQHLVSEKN